MVYLKAAVEVGVLTSVPSQLLGLPAGLWTSAARASELFPFPLPPCKCARLRTGPQRLEGLVPLSVLFPFYNVFYVVVYPFFFKPKTHEEKLQGHVHIHVGQKPIQSYLNRV